MLIEDSENNELILKWFNGGEGGEGENSIWVYPNLQSFRQIYTRYVKGDLAVRKEEKEEDNSNNRHNKQTKSRIILIATFYETVDSVKHNLSAVGADVHSHIDNGSLVIVDAFDSYFPDIDDMKKLVASLSECAKTEGRAGVINETGK